MENVQYQIFKNSLCGQNVEFVNVKPGGTYSNHWGWEGYVGYYVTLMCTGGFRYRCILYLRFRISGDLFRVIFHTCDLSFNLHQPAIELSSNPPSRQPQAG